MLRFVSVITLFVSVFFNELFATKAEDRISFTAVQSVKEAEPYFENIDEETLVIFDVDSVLTIPEDPALSPATFEEHLFLFKEMTKHLTKEQRHMLNHLILADGSSTVLETHFVPLVKKLQETGARVIAFTAAKTGSVGRWIQDFPKWRSAELQRLGFRFEKASNDDFYLRDSSEGQDDYPAFKEGILYSCGSRYKKGEVLHNFLKAVKMHPKKIIVIDDKEKNLLSIREAVQDFYPESAFHAIHYHGAKFFKRVAPSEVFQEKIKSLLEKVVLASRI